MQNYESQPKPEQPPVSPHQTSEEQLSLLWHFESLARVNQALQGTNDLEQALMDTLDALLSIFGCDRAWLSYPCDPDASTWQVPMERTRPEYPGLLPMGVELPADLVGVEVDRILRNADGPVKFGPGGQHPVPQAIADMFQVKSYIAMAFYPKVGKPWSFGLHQCSHERAWTSADERLFQEVGLRLSDTLSTLLAYQELQKNENQIRHLIDASPVAMIVSVGKDEQVELINSKFVELFGYTRNDVPDVDHWWPLAYPDDGYRETIRRQWQEKIEQAQREKSQVGPVEASVQCKDGSRRYVEIRLSSIGEKHIVTFVDLTERKQIEEALSTSEAELRTLMSAMPDIIFVLDEKGRYLKIIDTSPSLLYRPSAELLGKTLHEVFPKEQADIFFNHIHEALQAQASVNFEYSLPINSQELWFYATISPISNDRFMMVARDITDRKKMESELRRNRKSALQFSEQLAMLHEITNLLSKADSLDELCRQAVQFGYTRMGFERAGMWFIDAKQGLMRGSFGTDENGVLRDERNVQIQFKEEGLAWLLYSRKEQKALIELRPLYDHLGRQVGMGENAMAALWDGGEVLGVISVDNLITGQPISEQQLEILRLYATTVGHLITRKRAEGELQKTNQLLQAIIEAAPTAIVGMDMNGRVENVWNPAAEKMLGWKAHEVMGETLPGMQIALAEDLQISQKRLSLDGTPGGIEVQMQRRSGAPVDLNIFASTLQNADGQITGNIAVLVDVTERKHAEQALRRSEQKFRTLAENIPNVIFQCRNDARYTFIYLNNAVENLTGYPKEEFLEKGLSFMDLYHPDDLKAMPTPEENDLTDLNRAPFHVTYRIRHRSGEWRWVDEWGTGFENADGKVEFLEGVMIDITERIRAEEALRESEERYRQLVDLSPDAIVVYSEGAIVFANPAAVQLVRAARAEDLLGRSILDFVHSDFRASVAKDMERVSTLGISVPFVEETFLCLDGSAVDVEVAVVPYSLQGGAYTQVVARDITERKRSAVERETVITVSSALRRAATRSEILSILLDQLMDLFHADGAVIVFPDHATAENRVELGRGPVGERFTGLVFPTGSGISGWVIENKQAYLNNQVYSDSRFYRSDLLGDSTCVAAVPLIAQEKAIGALWIACHFEIKEQQLRLLTAIADIAANAIYRVMLYDRTAQQLRRLIALHEIDLAITANFDLDMTLKVILKNVQAELVVDAAGILLLDPVTHTLNYAAGTGFQTRGIEQSRVKIGVGCAGRAALEHRTIADPDLRQPPGPFGRELLLRDERFLSHYATPLIVKGQVRGVLEIFNRENTVIDQEWLDFFEALATQTAIAINSAFLFENLQRSNLELVMAYDATIEGWSRALDLRDHETEGHTQRVTEMVLELAEKMGLSAAEKINLRRGALLHDIGKMGVPDAILLKPGPLTDDEFEVMRQHPTYAFQMLAPIDYLKQAVDIPYCHHEKWDGTGYPRGLNGEQIPLAARMFAVVDVYDALTSNRPYRPAWPPNHVFRYLKEQAGKHFDPAVVEKFLEGVDLN